MVKLELLPAWHLLVALCATVGTFGCLKLLDSIFPLLDLFRGCWLPYCGVLGFGVMGFWVFVVAVTFFFKTVEERVHSALARGLPPSLARSFFSFLFSDFPTQIDVLSD